MSGEQRTSRSFCYVLRRAVVSIVLVFATAAMGSTADSVAVRFHYPDTGATQISVAGSFSNWDPSAHPLTKLEGNWEISILLPVGYYYYKLVVDGNWIADPANPHRVNDGGEGFNSIIKVGDPAPPIRNRADIPFPRDSVPRPILTDNPKLVELYYAAWEMAWAKITNGTAENGFVDRYMDEGFNDLIYQWDTCFMAAFGMYGRPVFPAMASLDNFYRKQRQDGYIQRVYWESTGKPAADPTVEEPLVNPPLFAWIEARYYRISGDSTRLERVLPHLVRYYDWMEEHLRAFTGKGLYYTSPLGSGMDNTPRDGVGRGGWIDMSCQAGFRRMVGSGAHRHAHRRRTGLGDSRE